MKPTCRPERFPTCARPRPRRRGLASVAIMIGLLIIGLIGFGLLKVGLARRGNVATEESRLQAGWLAQAGLDRAFARLAAEDYRGETWKIPAEDLGGRGAGSVAIRVEAVEGKTRLRKVRVEADFPSDSSSRARASKDTIIEIPPPSR